jgi:hypothetical protein
MTKIRTQLLSAQEECNLPAIAYSFADSGNKATFDAGSTQSYDWLRINPGQKNVKGLPSFRSLTRLSCS